MAQQEIRFIPKTAEDTIINFCYDSDDYSIEEVVDEIQKYLTKRFTLHKEDITLKGDWTRVPEVKRKFKIIRVYNLFKEEDNLDKL